MEEITDIVAIHELAEEFDEETARELAAAFLEDTASAFTQIDQGVQARDQESVRRAAHMLKGCSRVIKASLCEKASRELEVEAAAGNWESIPDRISDLRQAYASTETFLHSYIEGQIG